MEQHRAINKALRLEVGDHIWFTYAGKSQLSAKELKRLSGWTRNMRYVGEVVMLPADRYNPDGQLGVRLADVQTGKHQCTHIACNIESWILKGGLIDVEVKRAARQMELLFTD